MVAPTPSDCKPERWFTPASGARSRRALTDRVPFRGRATALAAELFATTLDVFVTLGRIAEDPEHRATADGRPATIDASRDRLARTLCADRESFGPDDAVRLARTLEECLLALAPRQRRSRSRQIPESGRRRRFRRVSRASTGGTFDRSRRAIDPRFGSLGRGRQRVGMCAGARRAGRRKHGNVVTWRNPGSLSSSLGEACSAGRSCLVD